MKAILFGVAAALTFVSGNVHEFFAEHHFICGKCEETVNYLLLGGKMKNFLGCIDKTGEEYTTVCSDIRNYGIGKISKLHNKKGLNAYQICEKLDMCSEWNDDKFSKIPAITDDLINIINNDPKNSWKAGKQKRFEGWSLADVRRILGTVVDPKHKYKVPEYKPTLKHFKSPIKAPTNFDSRAEWPYCANTIGHIRDQSACGSCWAFGSTESINDRLCIENVTSQLPFAQLLSVEDTTACCHSGGSMGCNGGQPSAVWSWAETAGIPSGGDYPDMGKTDTCEPYSLPECAHHVNSSQYPPCPSREYPTPRCVSSCTNKGYSKSWSADKHYTKVGTVKQFRGVTNIVNEISSHGSVSAAFTVYQDFLSYTSGVYVHKSGSALGGHAIKIFGYGVENGQDYWWCANSWNPSWGNKGFFKILKGRDECGIENDVTGGQTKS